MLAKFKLLALVLFVFSLCCGFTYAPLNKDNLIQYNNLALGDDFAAMVKNFGKPRFSQPDYAYHTKLTYYYYKDNTKIGIDRDTGQVVDIFIKSPYYAKNNDPKQGDTLYKLDKVYGPSKKEHLAGKLYYPYKSQENNQRLLFQLDPNTNGVETIRYTLLPLELEDEEYLPDDATSEELNPLIKDKVLKLGSSSRQLPPAKIRLIHQADKKISTNS